MIGSFEEMESLLAGRPGMRIAVVSAHEENVLLSLRDAAERGIVHPILVGDEKRIGGLLSRLSLSFDCVIVPAEDDAAAAAAAVALVKGGEAGALMKGIVPTDVFMRAVLVKEAGLLSGGLLSHVVAAEGVQPGRFVLVTDAGLNIAPDLEKKRRILENAAGAARTLGIRKPKVAVLCAVEKRNPSMPATEDAEELRRMNREGIIRDALVSGPISLDIALSKEAAMTKEYEGEVAGDADIFLVPGIEAGNILVKSMHYLAGIEFGGVILGARIPIVLTSRADSARGKLNSLMLAAALSGSDPCLS